MRPVFLVPPLGTAALVADRLMLPIMRWLAPQGEGPELTHFWNNIRFRQEKFAHLDGSLMVKCVGDPKAKRRLCRLDLRFHLGGWSRYAILEPTDYDDVWHVGWRTPTLAGVSRIPIQHQVRMFIGSEDTEFCGFKAENGEQVQLRLVAYGRHGINLSNAHIPLH